MLDDKMRAKWAQFNYLKYLSPNVSIYLFKSSVLTSIKAQSSKNLGSSRALISTRDDFWTGARIKIKAFRTIKSIDQNRWKNKKIKIS